MRTGFAQGRLPMKDGTSKATPRNKELPRIRMSSDELQAVRANANEQGLSLSEYVRRVSIDGKIVQRTPRIEVEAIRDLLKIGNNLNQLVKSGHIHSEVDLAELRAVLAQVQQVVTDLIE